MVRLVRPLTLGAVGAATLLAFGPSRAFEPVATFSIVGYDPEAREWGIAVQSKFFAVGSVVPWARAGVGAIATQAFANTTYGPRGLDRLETGAPALKVVETLVSSDDDRARRQLGIVDAKGNAAAHTGEECMAWAGHRVGKHYTVQGNILVGEETVAAMAQAFETTGGMLGERLLRALEAGQAAGGDSRGMQSAAILIVKEGAGYGGFNDRYCDLRVDDHGAPITELRRIFDLWKVNALVSEGYSLVEESAFDEAIAKGREAVALAPDTGEPWFHLACYQSRAGDARAALESLARAIRLDDSFAKRAQSDTDLAPLRDHARFVELTNR